MPKSVQAILSLLRSASPSKRSGFPLAGIGVGSEVRAERSAARRAFEPPSETFKNLLNRAMVPVASKRGATCPSVVTASASSEAEAKQSGDSQAEASLSDSENAASSPLPSSEIIPDGIGTVAPEGFFRIPAELLLSAAINPISESQLSPASASGREVPPADAVGPPAVESPTDGDGIPPDLQAWAVRDVSAVLPSDLPVLEKAMKAAPDAFFSPLPVKPALGERSSLNGATETKALTRSGEIRNASAELPSDSADSDSDSGQAAVRAISRGIAPTLPPVAVLLASTAGLTGNLAFTSGHETLSRLNKPELSSSAQNLIPGPTHPVSLPGRSPETVSVISREVIASAANASGVVTPELSPAPVAPSPVFSPTSDSSLTADSAIPGDSVDVTRTKVENTGAASYGASSGIYGGVSVNPPLIDTQWAFLAGAKAPGPSPDDGAETSDFRTSGQAKPLTGGAIGSLSGKSGLRDASGVRFAFAPADTSEAGAAPEKTGDREGMLSTAETSSLRTLPSAPLPAEAMSGNVSVLNPSSSPTNDSSSAGVVSSPPALFASDAAHPVAQVLEGAVYSVKNGHKELILRLNPDNLGEVRINLISHDGGRLNARLIADTPESRDLLQNQVQSLQSSLEAQGIRVERLSVILAGQSSEGHHRQAASGSDFQPSDSPPQNQAGQQGQSGFSDDSNTARHAMREGHDGLFRQQRHGGYEHAPSPGSAASPTPDAGDGLSEQAGTMRRDIASHREGQVSILV